MKNLVLGILLIFSGITFGQVCDPQANILYSQFYQELASWGDRLFEVDGIPFDINNNLVSDAGDAVRLVCLLDQLEPTTNPDMGSVSGGFIQISNPEFSCFSLWVEDNPTTEAFEFYEEQLFDLPPDVVPSSIPPFIMQGPSGQEDISLAVHENCITSSTLAYASDGEIYPSQYYVDKWVFFLPYNKVYRFGDPGIYGKINNLVAYSGEMFITHIEFKSPSIEPITVTIDSAPPGMTYGEAGGSRFFRWDVPLDVASGDYVVEATASQSGNTFPLRFEFEVLNLNQSSRGERLPQDHLPANYDLLSLHDVVIISEDGNPVTTVQDLVNSYAPILRLSDEGSFGVNLTSAGVTEYDYIPRNASIALDSLLVNNQYYFSSLTPPLDSSPTFSELSIESQARDGEKLFLDYRAEGNYSSRYSSLASSHDVSYYSSVRFEGADLFVTYWFFYYYNDWQVDHEGDWEFVQIRFSPSNLEWTGSMSLYEPVSMACSTHYTGIKRSWKQVQKYIHSNNLPLHPILYVSNGGHGTYMYSQNEFWHTYTSVSDDTKGNKNWIMFEYLENGVSTHNNHQNIYLENIYVLEEIDLLNAQGETIFPINYSGFWGEKGDKGTPGVMHHTNGNYNDGPQGPKFRLYKLIWKKPGRWHKGQKFLTPRGKNTVTSDNNIDWKGEYPTEGVLFDTSDLCEFKITLPISDASHYYCYLSSDDGVLLKFTGEMINQWELNQNNHRFYSFDFFAQFPNANNLFSLLVYNPGEETAARHSRSWDPFNVPKLPIDFEEGIIGYVHGSSTINVNSDHFVTPIINDFTASQMVIQAGETVNLTWNTSCAEEAAIENLASVPANGNFYVQPSVTTTYTLTATNRWGFDFQEITITVYPPPVIDSFSFDPPQVTLGDSSELHWETTNATQVEIVGISSTLPEDGFITITPIETDTYTLIASNPAGNSAPMEATIVVNPAPVIDSFTFDPTQVSPGGSSELRWETTNATQVEIVGISSSLPEDGFITITPVETTTYTLIASNSSGTSVSMDATVTVQDNPPYFDPVASLPSSVQLPDRIYFSGTAQDDVGLQTITMLVSGPVGSGIQAFTENVTGTNLDLSSYYFDSSNATYANVAGNYTVALWIKDSENQTESATFTVTVSEEPVPVIDLFAFDPSQVNQGESSQLNWETTNATQVEIVDVSSSLPHDGFITITPVETTTYTLIATNSTGDSVTQDATITVVTLPVIESFAFNPTQVFSGGSSELSWETTNASQVEIVGVSSSLPEDGFITITPVETTTYTLIVSSSSGDSVSQSETITVLTPGSTINIPDQNFKSFLVENYDLDGDSEISIAEAEFITTLNVSSENILDLTGIEYFLNITELDCRWNPIRFLDVSNNIKLEKLECSNTFLTSLDVSTNSNLKFLMCYSSRIETLNVGVNNNLRILRCDNNQITSLDTIGLPSLTELVCSFNQLTVLDVSMNLNLLYLWCSSNQLTSINFNPNSNLNQLICDSNQLTALDLLAFSDLDILICSSNQLTSLDVSNNTRLHRLDCDSNQLTSLSVESTYLAFFNCSNNQLVDFPSIAYPYRILTFHCYGNNFSMDDCSQIQSISALGVDQFEYNPQSDGSNLDCSTAPTVNLTAPTTPGTYQTNDTVTIEWETTNANSSDTIVLSMKRSSVPPSQTEPDGVNWYRFTENTPNDGSEVVTIPSGVALADDWRFFVRHVPSGVYDSSVHFTMQ